MCARGLLQDHRQELARLISLESGLCLRDTLHEVNRASDTLQFAANHSLVDDGQIFSGDLTQTGKARKTYTLREPLRGVIAAITPFNHPLNQVVHKVAPAIATNNRVILKPSHETPLSALAFADILYEAGLPGEMLQVITGEPGEIGRTLTRDPRVDLVTFTGGSRTGKLIAAQSIYKRLVLELGGNDAFIVMEDADVEKAAQLAAMGAYCNSGQRCTAVKRILVQESIASEFVEALVEETKLFPYGDPLEPSVRVGTVISESAANLIRAAVEDSVRLGARVLYGNGGSGALFAPTVVGEVQPSMPLVAEETFGPVAPVIRVADIEEAIAVANATRYGLSAGVCTSRIEYITRFISELQTGNVNIWEVPGYRLELTPFGGVNDSGLGTKEGVIEAAKLYTNLKTYSLPWASVT